MTLLVAIAMALYAWGGAHADPYFGRCEAFTQGQGGCSSPSGTLDPKTAPAPPSRRFGHDFGQHATFEHPGARGE